VKAKIRWYKNHDVEEKQKFLLKLEGSLDVLERLKAILEEMYQSSLKETETEGAYQVEHWPYFQAHHLGKRETLREIISLVTLTED
jgi:hypothetical protein